MTSSTHTRPVAQAPESAPPTRPEIHHLRAAGVSVVVDARGPRLPRIAHWGADLGDLDDGLLRVPGPQHDSREGLLSSCQRRIRGDVVGFDVRRAEDGL